MDVEVCPRKRARWKRRGGGTGPTQVVGGDDDALVELDGYYRRAGDDGRLRVLVGAVGLHVRGIIGAVDVVPGLRDPSVSLGEQVKVGESGLHEPCPKPEVGDPLSGMEAVCVVRRGVCLIRGWRDRRDGAGCRVVVERRRGAMGMLAGEGRRVDLRRAGELRVGGVALPRPLQVVLALLSSAPGGTRKWVPEDDVSVPSLLTQPWEPA